MTTEKGPKLGHGQWLNGMLTVQERSQLKKKELLIKTFHSSLPLRIFLLETTEELFPFGKHWCIFQEKLKPERPQMAAPPSLCTEEMRVDLSQKQLNEEDFFLWA